MFGDVAYQSGLVCSSKIKKECPWSYSIFTQSSFVHSSIWLFIQSFVQLILSPSFESKFEFVCCRSRHWLWNQPVYQQLLSHVLKGLINAILSLNSKYISVIDPLNDTWIDILLDWKGINRSIFTLSPQLCNDENLTTIILCYKKVLRAKYTCPDLKSMWGIIALTRVPV